MNVLYTDEESVAKIKKLSAQALYDRTKVLNDEPDRHRVLMYVVFDLLQYGQTDKAEELLLLGIADDQYYRWLQIDGLGIVVYALEEKKWPMEEMVTFIELLNRHEIPITIL